MNYKQLVSGLIIAGLGFALAGCTAKPKEKEPAAKQENQENLSLSFGAMPAVDSLPVYIAEKEGYFKEEGLTLDLQRFKSPKDRDAAFSSGHLEGANSDLIAVSAYQMGDLEAKIVSQSSGTFSILTGDESVKSLKELKDKKVGYAKNQAPFYFLDQAVKTEGLSVNDLGFEEVPQIPVRVELVKNKKIAATVVPEPFRTIGLASGLTELANSNDLDIQTTVFAFTAQALKENKKAIQAFYRAYDKGVDYLNTHELDDYYDVLEKNIGFSQEIKDQVELPKYVHAKQVDESQLKAAFDWSTEQGILTKKWQTNDVLSSLLSETKD